MEKQKKEKKDAHRYQACQFFGSQQVIECEEGSEEEKINCLRFDPTGEYLAIADSEGRVIIFKESSDQKHLQSQVTNGSPRPNYQFFAEFQSHDRDFDRLTNEFIVESISDMSWLNPQGKYLKLLTANSKDIKIWKCHEKMERSLLKAALIDHNKQLHLPKFQSDEPIFSATQMHKFANVHKNDIRSISKSNNEAYLLSCDEKEVFLWDLNKYEKRPYRPIGTSIIQCYDQKTNLNCIKMHPTLDCMFVMGMSKNSQVDVCDMRNPEYNNRVIRFGRRRNSAPTSLHGSVLGNITNTVTENSKSKQAAIMSKKNFFSDMISSVSAAEFTKNGKFIISRQFLNIKIWDVCQNSQPLFNICVRDELKSKLVELFEKDKINEDAFQVSTCCQSQTILTGSYNGCFNLIDIFTGENHEYQTNPKNKTIVNQIYSGGRNGDKISRQIERQKQLGINHEEQIESSANRQKNQRRKEIDLNRRISATDFHPSRKCLAASIGNNFYVYEI